MDKDIWTLKYEPCSSNEVMQPNVKTVKDFIINFGKGRAKKAMLIYGPTGCGKTSSVHAIANELELEIIELNASDFRNSDSISSIAGSASVQKSLFGKSKIILIDELDGISGQQDRGGIAEISRVIEKSRFPVIMTANDPFEQKFSQLRKSALLLEYSALSYQDIHLSLEKICKSERISYDEPALKTLALRAGGDLRGAINDLKMLSYSSGKICSKDVEELSERDRESSITKALLMIFKSTDIKLALRAFDNIDEDLERCMMWIDENLPDEYQNAQDIQNAYQNMSKSDVFMGRIRKSQHWRFLVYVNALLSAGVALSKKTRNRHALKYNQPTRALKIYISNAKNAKLKSIAQKLSFKTNCSLKRAIREQMPFLRMMYRNKNLSKLISEELELDEDETEWLQSNFLKP